MSSFLVMQYFLKAQSDSSQASMFVLIVFYYIDHICIILLFYYIILQFVFIDVYHLDNAAWQHLNYF